MLAGLVLFSHMIRLHPRYVEGFTPAVAAMFGIGVSWAASSPPPTAARRGCAGRVADRLRLALLAVTLAITVYYGERLLYGTPGVWWVSRLAALGAIALRAARARAGATARVRSLAAPAGVIALTLVAVLAIPLKADVTAIDDRVSDAGLVGALPGAQQHPLERIPARPPGRRALRGGGRVGDERSAR